MATAVIFFILAAAVSGLDQICRLKWYEYSWLPNWVFFWNLGIGKIDAWHTYQGAVYLLLPLGFRFLPLEFWWWAGGILVWFQARNLFMHVIWMAGPYRRWPFFRSVI